MSYIGYSPTQIVGVRTGDTFPTSGSVGELFYNTETQHITVWDGTAWNAISGEIQLASGNTLPESGLVGQMFYLLTDLRMYIWNGTDWEPMLRGNEAPPPAPEYTDTRVWNDVLIDRETEIVYLNDTGFPIEVSAGLGDGNRLLEVSPNGTTGWITIDHAIQVDTGVWRCALRGTVPDTWSYRISGTNNLTYWAELRPELPE